MATPKSGVRHLGTELNKLRRRRTCFEFDRRTMMKTLTTRWRHNCHTDYLKMDPYINLSLSEYIGWAKIVTFVLVPGGKKSSKLEILTLRVCRFCSENLYFTIRTNGSNYTRKQIRIKNKLIETNLQSHMKTLDSNFSDRSAIKSLGS